MQSLLACFRLQASKTIAVSPSTDSTIASLSMDHRATLPNLRSLRLRTDKITGHSARDDAIEKMTYMKT